MINRYRFINNIILNINKRYYFNSNSNNNNNNNNNNNQYIKYSKNHTWVSIPKSLNHLNSFEISIPGENESDEVGKNSGSGNGDVNGETIVTFGLTEQFINLNTKYDDILYIKFPLIDNNGIIMNKECITIETMSDYYKIYSPLSGKVIKINQDLLDYPNDLNQDPHKNWLAKLSINSNNIELDQLMDKKEYNEYCKINT